MFTSINCPNGGTENGDDIEFAIRFMSNPYEWIPLLEVTTERLANFPVYRRGYLVPHRGHLHRENSMIYTSSFSICGFALSESIQLRWLARSYFLAANPWFKDLWSVDDVQVELLTETGTYKLLSDTFENSTW